jgi:hypothetical protein
MARTVDRHLPEVQSDPGLVLLSDALSGQAPQVRVMTLLQEHVPLSLLCDLATMQAPLSAEILAEEGLPDDIWWVP